MSEQYSRRYFLRAAFLGGGVLASASLAPGLLPMVVKAGADPRGGTGRTPLTRTSLFMGTIVSISVANALSEQAEEGMGRAFAVGRQLADVFSRFDSGSALSALNTAGFLANTPPALLILLERARRMSALTNGAFDVTVLPVLRLLEARRNPQGVMRLDAGEMREALELVGADHLQCGAGRIGFARSGMASPLTASPKGISRRPCRRNLRPPAARIIWSMPVATSWRTAARRRMSPGALQWKIRISAAASRKLWSLPRAAAWPLPAAMKSFTTPRKRAITWSVPPQGKAGAGRGDSDRARRSDGRRAGHGPGGHAAARGAKTGGRSAGLRLLPAAQGRPDARFTALAGASGITSSASKNMP